MAIAIDFGTSNTLVTRWNNATAQPEVLNLGNFSQKTADNPPLVPSLLYVKNALQQDCLIGQQVYDQGLNFNQNPRLFRNFKRGIGTTIQGFLPELDGQAMTFEQIGSWFLNGLVTQLRERGEALDSLVLTVPVDSFEAYRRWLMQVCEAWSIDRIQMLDEPTAAALGYGAIAADMRHVLVLDFGGGTVDFSLVDLNRGQGKSQPTGFILKWGKKRFNEQSPQKSRIAKVLAKAGKNLGGADLDNWLLDYFQTSQNLPANALSLRLVERLKIALSRTQKASEVYYDATTFESYELAITRAQFNQILTEQGFFEQLDELMSQVLQQSRRQGLDRSDIDAVLLVGGSSQIPAIQEWLAQYFLTEKIKQDQPFVAIASGALQLAKGFELKDFLYHSYGIRYWNRRKNRHDWHPIIPQGQPYPMTEPIVITLGASVDEQPSIELIVGELGEDKTGTEVYFEGDRLVTRALGQGQANVKPLNDRDGARTLAKLDPVGYPGSDRIKLEFLVDVDRCLKVTVEDLLSNTTLLDNRIVADLS